MRLRPFLWFVVSVSCFVAAAYFWRLGNRWAAESGAPPAAQSTNENKPATPESDTNAEPLSSAPAPMRLLTDFNALQSPARGQASLGTPSGTRDRRDFRVSNTAQTAAQLVRNPSAILLENAFVDTTEPGGLDVPPHLQSTGDPGTYVVQSRGPIDSAFRHGLEQAGFEIVGYIPNNAYLVRGNSAAAANMRLLPQTQAVLAYEPYYKLRGGLLKTAVEQQALPNSALLNVLMFRDARERTLAELRSLGMQVLTEERSPFGPVVKVRPFDGTLWELAALTGVQQVEPARARVPANDLSRVTLGVATNAATATNYLDLTGRGITVNINDTGVDTNHPALAGRVFGPFLIGLMDTNGHGTHVAGIIAGDGAESAGVEAQGSDSPVADTQFRGIAHEAELLSLPWTAPDPLLQETVARTNVLISNNSWYYLNAREYDLAAASYDAAVRDALPEEPGAQPVLFVFSAGNGGRGFDDGKGGLRDSILSPGTAKNVITVGALEQARNITNEVVTSDGQTNKVWQLETDSSDEVAAYSGRGNVGYYLENDYGRFKPDVVAPGTFVVSTRSTQMDTNAFRVESLPQLYSGITLGPNQSYGEPFFIPANAVRASISVVPNRNSPFPFPPQLVYVDPNNAPPPGAYFATNQVIITDPTPVDSYWNYAISNPNPQTVIFDLIVDVWLTNEAALEFERLNEEVGPYYRYESGTSMAAGKVSGMLALMQEFFEQRLGHTNSPALMKALLINGARSAGNLYDFQVTNEINFQGWGLANLRNSLHGGLAAANAQSNSMFYLDQSPTNALATGQSQTFKLTLSPAAQAQPLRVTLVWTDPPGNPAAGVKLVNDLDLVVTNLDATTSTNVVAYLGNDIVAGSDYNRAMDTNGLAGTDVVNNVENVFLNTPLAENYSITVRGARVNVNAVPGHTNNVVQDFALVISSGDGIVTNAMSFEFESDLSLNEPSVTVVTNRLPNSTNYLQGRLERQRAGANSPMIGTNTVLIPVAANSQLTVGVTNQWRFYAFTNQEGFPYMRFRVSVPANLAVPRMGAREAREDDATREQPDVDLYVSMDSQLTNLVPAAVSNAYKSYSRLGTEAVFLSNAPAGIFYAGVKAEDQMAGEYTFEVTSSREPFALSDGDGNQTLRWLEPEYIPDGTPENPGTIRITLGGGGESILVRRVIVTNVLTHELMGDLEGVLSYEDGTYAVLNNHSPESTVSNRVYIYDDSEEGDRPFSRPSDGPGTLLSFGGKRVSGTWTFTMIDNSFNHVGTNEAIVVWLERQPDLTGGVFGDLDPGRCTRQYVEVGPEVTSLEIDTSLISGTGPLWVEVCPLGRDDLCVTNSVVLPGTTVTIRTDYFSDPPLIPGVYQIRLCNLGPDRARWFLLARLSREPGLIRTTTYATNPLVQIKDDAISYATIDVNEHSLITSLDIGLLINHPRISDLALTLISPNGTRILLTENRGALSDEGMGGIVGVVTNSLGLPVYAVTNLVPVYTNDLERAAAGFYAPGAVFQGWNVLSNYSLVLPDYSFPWLSNQVLVLGDSSVSNSLPTTNSTMYRLQFRATHAPYLVGTVGWWPLDRTGEDIFGGWNGLLFGGGDQTNLYSMFHTGKVNQAFYGDGVRAGMVVPATPELNLGLKRGFSIEGWIKPTAPLNVTNIGGAAFGNGFEDPVNHGNLPAPRYFAEGWHVDSGDVDLMKNGDFGVFQAHSGVAALDINGWGTGLISTNIQLESGKSYRFSCAFARNPDSVLGGVFPQVGLDLGGVRLITIRAGMTNTWNNLGWQTTSVVFTATSPSALLQVRSLTSGSSGVLLDSFEIEEAISRDDVPQPIVEWSTPPVTPTNQPTQGVQFWLSGTDKTNQAPGALAAIVWTTNGQSYPFLTPTNSITNGGWQHVAFTYDNTTAEAKLYANGQLLNTSILGSLGMVPNTEGNIYFGFHPGSITNLECFKGGMDEFGIYERPLSPCEVSAIHLAGAGGKYGTNVLSCPVTNSVQLITDTTTTYQFTHGLNWTNGPQWETVTIDFTNPLLTAGTNGIGTNWASLIITPLDPNLTVDDFVLSALTTNLIEGVLNFTENTNIAVVPMKFAPWPYNTVGFQSTQVFSNDFENALPGRYQAGEILPGMSAAAGVRDWTVVNGPITVVSNSPLDMTETNWVALARGSVESELPTRPGTRYELTYSVRGPAAVGWWNGDIEPLTRRARDLIGGNHGQFLNGATNHPLTYVGSRSLYFDGYITNDYGSKLELADPENLRLTNALTIEGWIRPIEQTNFSGTEQIFFRGDERGCLDPYNLALEPFSLRSRNIRFHIEDGTNRTCGVDAFTVGGPVNVDEWQHIAAVFEPYVELPNPPYVTNQLRIYLNGSLVASNYTGMFPFGNLDPGFLPGAAIGNHSRYRYDQAFRGYMDELSVYSRALTEPEIVAIHAASQAGKADMGVAAPMSLAKVRLSLNGIEKEVAAGANSKWTRRTVTFIAETTNTVVRLDGLLPGTLVNDITLSEVPNGLYYLPEESLNALIGEDAFGTWTLEIWDNRTGATNFNPELVSWQLQFQTRPLVLAPTIYLSHGITYTNNLLPNSTQNFILEVPQWATMATNALLFASNSISGVNLPVSVFMDTNDFPSVLVPPSLLGPVTPDVRVLTTNTLISPYIVPGQPYFLTITNPNPVAATFALGVWFDITSLTNCVLATNSVGPAGIPRYFQFDVPTNDVPAHEVVFWLSGVQTNVTVVLNQHLPLPDLTHYDYISRAVSTNNEIVMLLTNTTPFPAQSNRWYVGVFNSEATNVPFSVQACYLTDTNFPVLIPLTNNVPYVAGITNPFVAPPGPPRWFFYEFNITNYVDAVLFELYDAAGDLDLTLQRHLPSGMAPYFEGSYESGLSPEQIVLRTSFELPDLRGKWYLGVYNNELTNVSYTVRASLLENGLLTSALPIQSFISPPLAPRGPVVQWNAVVGEVYIVEFTPRLRPATWTPVLQPIVATTPTPAVEIQTQGVSGFYRVVHVPRSTLFAAPLSIQRWGANQVRISWSTSFPGYTLQFAFALDGSWQNAGLPVTTEGNEYVVYDTISSAGKYYRLIP